MFKEIIFIATAYLTGGILFSYLIPKLLYQKDIRKYGSKNPGARNAYRLFGKVGIFCGALDILKTALIVIIAGYFLSPLFVYLTGIASVIGHIFPVYFNFHGGLGVASSYGFLLALIFLLFVNPIEGSYYILFLLIIYTQVSMYIADKINKRKKISYNIK